MIVHGSKKGFTLVEIMIVVAIIGLLAAIAVPNFMQARESARAGTCINNMRQIESAKEQWALETGADTGDPVTSADIDDYIKGATVTFPVCPINDTAYALTNVGTNQVCPNVGTAATHVLP